MIRNNNSTAKINSWIRQLLFFSFRLTLPLALFLFLFSIIRLVLCPTLVRMEYSSIPIMRPLFLIKSVNFTYCQHVAIRYSWIAFLFIAQSSFSEDDLPATPRARKHMHHKNRLSLNSDYISSPLATSSNTDKKYHRRTNSISFEEYQHGTTQSASQFRNRHSNTVSG